MTSEKKMKSVTLSVNLPVDLHIRAKEAAKAKHMPLAAVVRQALENYLTDGRGTRMPETLDGVEDTVKRIEQALDRVLVETIRLGDRVSGIDR